MEARTQQLLEHLWKEAPQIKNVLRNNDLEGARVALFAYLNQLEWEYRSGERKVHPLIAAQAIQAINVLKNIISPRNEKLAGTSSLKYLWLLARGKVPPEVKEDFILEFIHLFKAIYGRPEIYPAKYAEDLPYFDFSKVKEPGKARSDYLDELARRVWRYIERYPSGLDKEVIEKRKRNKKKILEILGGTDDDWEDYMWHFRNSIRGLKAVEILKNFLSEEDLEAVRQAVERGVPFGITPYYLHLFDFDQPYKDDIQVRRQVLPTLHYVREMILHLHEREVYFDFMREHDTSPHPLITRRYPMVAILKAAHTCPQICVYCQRNWEIMVPDSKEAIPTRLTIDQAIDWFAEHPYIIDVLVTGGDPFLLDDKTIEHILKRLSELDHVKMIRFGSRILVTVPMRITKEFAEMIGSYIEPGKRNIHVVTHVESAYEVTPEMAQAVTNLRKQGIYVYNQQVYTLYVSRRFETVALRIALKKIGIDPYYTFYPKGKYETKDYLVPVARIVQERKEEARLLPGVFRTEEPVFNVPRLGKVHLRASQDRELIMIRPDGKRVYLWHPWEKNIHLVEPYVFTELVSIKEYLDKLKEMGEDLEDYKSIWYYY